MQAAKAAEHLVILLALVRQSACRAVLPPVLEHHITPSTVGVRVKRAVAEQTVKSFLLFDSVAWEPFAFPITKKTAVIFD